MDLLEDPRPTNAPEFTVSELAGALKKVVEGTFPLVRLRGEVGRVSRASSGHTYFDLKDDRAVISAVAWKGARLTARPEEGLEVVATGRLTTFPGQSRYQIVVEDLAHAGAGALLAQLEARRRRLADEGLFDPARKRPIPYLPDVIGVVTSPQGAVIRDILHRLRDRFPRHVLVWPVAVQGPACPGEVARAVQGFNALPPGGPIPRPDLLIVARGGGSVEDLWGFNDEAVVRAVAASLIPVISAVGHETDTTLVDFAADLRAPTPTAAAEMAVPVRLELLERAATLGARAGRALRGAVASRGQRLADLARALPRPADLTGGASQRLDFLAARLPAALRRLAGDKREGLAAQTLRPGVLTAALRGRRQRVEGRGAALAPALARGAARARERLDQVTRRLEAQGARLGERKAGKLDQLARSLRPLAERGVRACGIVLSKTAPRLDAAGANALASAKGALAPSAARLSPALPLGVIARLSDGLDALDRLAESLSYRATLARGFAVARAEGRPVTTAAEAARHALLDLEFADGAVALGRAAPRRAPRAGATDGQGSLL